MNLIAVAGPIPLNPSGLKSVPNNIPISISCSLVILQLFNTLLRLISSGSTLT